MQPLVCTMYRPRSAMARCAGSVMPVTGGAASRICRPNSSGGVVKNGGMKYRNAPSAATARSATMASVHLRILFMDVPLA